MPSLDQAERWYRARATAAYMSAIRGKLAWIIPLDVFIVSVLAFVGYPVPRILALAATLAASLGMFTVWLSRNCSDCVPSVKSAQGETLRMIPRILLMFLAMALTGGIRSPLLATILYPFSDLVIKNGWSQMAKTILALIAGCLVAMIVLPASWFGPDVPQPAYWILLLAILAISAAWHTRYALLLTRTIGDSACQLGRAREEVVYRAVARAREMEQIGLKLSHELKNPLAAIKGLVQLSARAAYDMSRAQAAQIAATESALAVVMPSERAAIEQVRAQLLSELDLVRLYIKSGDTTVDFQPNPPVTLMAFNKGQGSSWTSAGVDRRDGTSMVVEGTITKRTNVDLCGQVYDTYEVISNEHIANLRTGLTSNTDPNDPNVYDVATHYGGIFLRQHISTTTTFPTDSGTTTVVSNYTQTLDSITPIQ